MRVHRAVPAEPTSDPYLAAFYACLGVIIGLAGALAFWGWRWG
jgi:hypothetical protein